LRLPGDHLVHNQEQLGEMKINKKGRPRDSFGFPLALNWNIVLDNQAQGKPLTQGAYIITDNSKPKTKKAK
jgi:hypothetical protein